MIKDRIAVVSDDSHYLATIRNLSEPLDAEVVLATSKEGLGETSAAGIMAHRPGTVLLGPGLSFDHRVGITQELDARHPEVVVIWAIEGDADAWEAATKAGARNVHTPNTTPAALLEQLQAAIAIGDRRRDIGGSPIADGEVGLQKGRIITIVSPKGGSGKTMLTTNLAVGLQQNSPKGVVIVDLDLQFGDVPAALGLRPEYSLLDVLRSRGDATDMKAFLAGHPTGLYTLPAPNNPVQAEEVESDELAKLLDSLSAEFGTVIVDTGAGIDESTLVAVEQSTDVVFITTIDVAAVQALSKVVAVLDRLRLNDHKRWFVLNRSSSRTGLSRKEVEEVTGLLIDAEVPSHRSVSESMNQGRPLVLSHPRSRPGKALASVIKLIGDTPATRKAR